jgi:hypothetical protein
MLAHWLTSIAIRCGLATGRAHSIDKGSSDHTQVDHLRRKLLRAKFGRFPFEEGRGTKLFVRGDRRLPKW